MKKWYFSENGSVTGPYSISEANTLLEKNNDVYGWNPTFSQWLPVTQIPEFSELIPDSKPAAQVPKELIDRFVTKKRDLNKKIKLIDETIKNTEEHIELFDNEINQYKSLTESLSVDVKNNIVPLEKKHQLVMKQLQELKKAAEIAKHEIIDVVQEFGDLVLSKANENAAGLSELKELPEFKNETATAVSKPVNSERAGYVNSTASKKVQAKPHNASKNVETTEKLDVVAQKELNNNNKNIERDTSTNEYSQEQSSENEVNSEQNAFSGVKNKFKSVFKPKAEEPTVKLSDKLKQLEQPPKEVVTQDENDAELIEDSEEQKTTRRRRRRF